MVAEENMSQQVQEESFLKNQLNVQEIGIKLRWLLRNYWWDDTTKSYTNVIGWKDKEGNIRTVRPIEQELPNYTLIYSEPKLNEEGINAVVSEVVARVSNAYGSANLKEEDMRSTRLATAFALWSILHKNRDRFEMRVENMKSILFIVDDQILLFLSRSVSGGFFKGLGKLLGMKESYNYNLTGTPKEILNQPSNDRRGLF